MCENNTRTEIGNCERMILGQRVSYKLYLENKSNKARYAIAIRRGEEYVNNDFGEDFLSVAILFTEIVNGEVLPYSLEEISEDFQNG